MPDGSNAIAQPVAAGSGLHSAGCQALAAAQPPRVIAFVTDAATEQAVSDGVTDVSRVRRTSAAAASAPRSPRCRRRRRPHPGRRRQRRRSAAERCSAICRQCRRARCLRAGRRRASTDVELLSRDHPRAGRGRLPATSRSPRDMVVAPFRRSAVRPGARRGAGPRRPARWPSPGCAAASARRRIAVNLAWHFGVTLRRHTVLLDPDLHLGTAAFLLNVPRPGRACAWRWRSPDRIDALLAERAAQPGRASGCMCWPARRRWPSQLDLCAGGAAATAGGAAAPLQFHRGRRALAAGSRVLATCWTWREQRVLVHGADAGRVRDDAAAAGAADRAAARRNGRVLVLNRVGMPGGLTRRQVEDALKMKVDVAIPDLPRKLGACRDAGRARHDGQQRLPRRHRSSWRARWRRRAALTAGRSAACPLRPRKRRPGWRLFRRTLMTALRAGFGRREARQPPRGLAGPGAATPVVPTRPAPAASASAMAELRTLCLARLDPAAVAAMPAGPADRRGRAAAARRSPPSGASSSTRANSAQLAPNLVHDMLGLGPLEPLLEDDSDQRHHGQRPEQDFVERRGKVVPVEHPLPRHRRTSPTSASASPPPSAAASTKSSPMVDARLKDGSPRQHRLPAAGARRALRLDPQVRQEGHRFRPSWSSSAR